MSILFSDMVSGIVLGVLGFFLLSFSVFASTNGWVQSMQHWCTGIIGATLIFYFWRHTMFYMGLWAIASYVCDTDSKGGCGPMWNRYSATLLRQLFTVQIQNYAIYNPNRDEPVIFVINHLARARPMDEFCLALIDQPNLRIVALARAAGSQPEKILRSLRAVEVKHGGGHDEFMNKCEKAIQAGDSLLVFAEGKHTERQRHWTQLVEFQSSAFELSIKTGCRIVPIIIEGFNNERGWIKGFGQGARPLQLHYLDPVKPAMFSGQLDTSVSRYRELVRHTMNTKLSSLLLQSLPPEKRIAHW